MTGHEFNRHVSIGNKQGDKLFAMIILEAVECLIEIKEFKYVEWWCNGILDFSENPARVLYYRSIAYLNMKCMMPANNDAIEAYERESTNDLYHNH